MLDAKEKFKIFENLKPTQLWSLLEILFFPEQWEMETWLLLLQPVACLDACNYTLLHSYVLMALFK